MHLVKGLLRGAKKSGERFIQSYCPFHKGGQEIKRSFMISKTDGHWWCYSCKQYGDLKRLFSMLGATSSFYTDFASQYEGIGVVEHPKTLDNSPFNTDPVLPEGLLGVYDYMPTVLTQKGYHPSTLKFFEVGVDLRRYRITFPIRDLDGTLVGIAGKRLLEEEVETLGKYTIYRPSEIDAEVSGYSIPYTGRYLWNAHNLMRHKEAGKKFDFVIVVEGYKALMWVWQCGFPEVVATFGAKITFPYIPRFGKYTPERYKVPVKNQVQAILRLSPKRVLLFFDNDSTGRSATYGDRMSLGGFKKKGLALKLSNYVPVQIMPYPRQDAMQPDFLSSTEIEWSFINAA